MIMLNDELLERKITLKDVQRLYKLIGQNDFIDLLLSNEIEKIVIKKKFQTNETFEYIGKLIGMTTLQTMRVYEKAIRRIKQQIRKFINFYISIKSNKNYLPEKTIKDYKNTESNPKATSQTNAKNLVLSNIIESNIKWVNTLKNNGIYSIGDLIKYSRKELLLLPLMGLQSIQEIEFLLNHYNLKLANK